MNFGDFIDMRTALFFLAINNLMLAGLMASHAHASESRTMVLHWALARTLQSASLALLCLRDILPDTLTVPLACSLLILGVTLEARAVVRYWQHAASPLYYSATACLAILLIALSWLLQAPAGLRILIVAGSAILAIFPIARIYVQRWRGATLLHRVITFTTCLLLLALALRTLDAFLHLDTSVYSNGHAQFLTLVALLLFTVFNGFAFLLQMHQQTEQQLQLSEASLERAQSIAQVYSWSIDFTRNLLHRHTANGHEHLTIDSDNVISHLFDHSSPEELATLQSAWTRAMRDKQDFDLMHRVCSGDEIRWLHSRAEFEYGSDGRLLRATGASQDVTALRVIQEALESYQRHLEHLVAERTDELREAEAQTRLILESTAEGMLGFNTSGDITFANHAAGRILGGEPDDLIGKSAHTALGCQPIDAPPSTSEECHLLESLFATGTSLHATSQFRHANGHFLPVSCSAQPMWRDGRIVGAVLSFVDITVQEQARQAREQALSEAQRLARVRSEFIANMSHEIRTPLNAVLGLAQLGARDTANAPGGETFKRILESGRHLLNVVNDILDFSKIEAGKLQLEDGNIVLGTVIDRVIDLTAGLAHQKKLVFRVEETLDLPRGFRGDALRLTQILINLVGNAIKFTEHGSVTLAITTSGEEIFFRIRDTGIGIRPEDLGHLFRAFEQTDGTTTRRFGGTGLGLVISQRLAHLMGGEIKVSSEPQVGSQFELRLPLRDTSAAALPATPQRIHLVGIENVSARQLSCQLQSMGIEARLSALQEAASDGDSRTFLHYSVLEDPQALETVAQLLESPMKPVFVIPAGAVHTLPSPLRNATTTLEEPLRLRHLLTELSGNHETPSVKTLAKCRLRGIRILAAEDNAVNQLVLEDMLLYEGADLVCVENGRLAVEMLQTRGDKAFDIVLTDIQMPEMDGYETARRIAAMAPRLPVIGLTAHAMPEERQRCLDAGMVEHISKPIELETLIETILQQVAIAAREQAGTVNLMTSADATPVDWAALETQFGAQDGLIDKLVQAMLHSSSQAAEKLRSSAANKVYSDIAFVAHKLKGASANLKSQRLYDLADRTERAARAEKQEAGDYAIELSGVIEVVRAELQKRIRL